MMLAFRRGGSLNQKLKVASYAVKLLARNSSEPAQAPAVAATWVRFRGVIVAR